MQGVKHLDSLIEFVSIPSVSADSKYKPDVLRAAQWLEHKLQSLGFSVEVISTPGHPIVYAEKQVNPSAPTVLIYGHYDVQPPEPLELWHTPPFTPTVRDGKLYARGASDDKGQIFAHIAAVEDLGPDLAVNVKFLIEGEEEISSTHLPPFVAANTQRLKADALLISDGAIFAPGVPSLDAGLRGLVYLEVHLEGAGRDLHSGSYGGAVPNATNAIAWMIAKLKAEDGRVLIPGYYDKVRPLTDLERQMWQQLPFSEEEFKASIGVSETPGEPGYSNIERRWARPTLDVNGLWGGYQGEGAKTVIPAKAGFKFSMRLVPDQDPAEIKAATEAYLQRILPPGYRMTVLSHGTGKAVLTDIQSEAMQKAAKALELAWGRPAIITREGGSIPIVAEFQELLKVPIVLLGMGYASDGPHAPNEHFHLENFEKGILASRHFLQLMAQ